MNRTHFRKVNVKVQLNSSAVSCTVEGTVNEKSEQLGAGSDIVPAPRPGVSHLPRGLSCSAVTWGQY